MRVLILGSGVIGVTTAYCLAQGGAEVTVIDRQSAPALETSFANAGQISPGYASPWAAPGMPLKAIRWLCQQHAPLSIRFDGTLWQWQWAWQLLRQCSASRYGVNKERMVRLAEYSRDRLREWRLTTGLSYEGRSQGTLQVFRTSAQLRGAQKDVAVLSRCQVPFELLTPAQCAEREPGLARVLSKLVGGLYLPGDETGDCHKFTVQLSERARQLGVRFRFHANVEQILRADDRIVGVQVDGECLRADAYVVALASYSRALLQSLGLDLPVYPVKGYSLTVPVSQESCAPQSTVLDETYKVAITRFDHRIRVGGMAELAGFDQQLRTGRCLTLKWVLQNLFLGAGRMREASFWAGLRPMTPDGSPIVGPTPYGNLWLNTGHGTLGWTMACGSGQVLADQILGRVPAIRCDDLQLARYHTSSRKHAPVLQQTV